MTLTIGYGDGLVKGHTRHCCFFYIHVRRQIMNRWDQYSGACVQKVTAEAASTAC